MILDAIIGVGRMLLALFAGIFGLINYAIPVQATNAITYLFSYMRIVGGVFPIQTVLDIITATLAFFALFYTFKIILWVFAHLPWIGSSHPMPNQKHK